MFLEASVVVVLVLILTELLLLLLLSFSLDIIALDIIIFESDSARLSSIFSPCIELLITVES